jgi:hypothetical protein
MRKDDQITRAQRERPAITLDLCITMTVGEEMEDDDMLRTRGQIRREYAGRR